MTDTRAGTHSPLPHPILSGRCRRAGIEARRGLGDDEDTADNTITRTEEPAMIYRGRLINRVPQPRISGPLSNNELTPNQVAFGLRVVDFPGGEAAIERGFRG